MKLSELLPALPECTVLGDRDCEVSALRYDSRRVAAGDLFFAWSGANADGHQFVADACQRGAAAVVLEKETPRPETTTFVRVPDARRALALIAGSYYHHPAQALTAVGITGTNGKTTTAFITKHLLRAKWNAIGLLGTVRYEIGETVLPASRTTPEGSDLQELLAKMVAAKCGAVVMEVSSHALDQGRVAGIDYAAAVFTNLTPDHLDYHPTMEAYFQAKRRLFDGLKGTAILNLDDPYGARLAEERKRGATIGFSASGSASASLRAESIHATARGTAFDLVYNGARQAVEISLIGRFNVANVLGAVGVALALGLDLPTIASRLAAIPAVPGRLERLENSGGNGKPVVVVDYAHTEDAVRKALATLRELKPKHLAVVVGCGGNRDKTKRPKMASAAIELADKVYFTADNPRRETIAAIFDDMRAGVPANKACAWIEDRRAAIERAIAEAGPDDVVCIAGKGHEATQEVNGVFTPFSDQAVAQEILARKENA